MYYVNREQIDLRLQFIPVVIETLRHLKEESSCPEIISRFAQERAIHLAAECVTDIGSYLIDAFIMRDASSYEDIIDILYGEQVITAELHPLLSLLVRQRKPLVQDYYLQDRKSYEELANKLPQALADFAQLTITYIDTELRR
jgi:uncharacterized protein YutE (UPF0331/DUF86 family)